jgi:tetratricopeptide (TPR) repeat protein
MEAASSDHGDFAQRDFAQSQDKGDIVPGVRLAIVCSVVALALGPRWVHAAPAAEIAREFQAGADAYRLGKYEEARLHLDKVLRLDPTLPGPHRFLAAVASAQQHWDECIAEARRAIQLNPRSREIADTRKLHDECRARLGRPAYRAVLGEGAAIAVVSNVAGAMVRIGGLRYGRTPVAPRRIRPGAHELDLDKQGFRRAHRAVNVLPGIVTDVVIDLEPMRPDPPPATPRERTSRSVH